MGPDEPVVSFRGDAVRWSAVLGEVPIDAIELAHASCFAEREGDAALAALIPPDPVRDSVEDCRGQLVSGQGWTLSAVYSPSALTERGIAEFQIRFPGAMSGLGWLVPSDVAIGKLAVSEQLACETLQVAVGSVSKAAADVITTLDNDETISAAIAQFAQLPYNVVIASAPWPRTIRRLTALRENGEQLADADVDEPSVHITRHRQHYADAPAELTYAQGIEILRGFDGHRLTVYTNSIGERARMSGTLRVGSHLPEFSRFPDRPAVANFSLMRDEPDPSSEHPNGWMFSYQDFWLGFGWVPGWEGKAFMVRPASSASLFTLEDIDAPMPEEDARRAVLEVLHLPPGKVWAQEI